MPTADSRSEAISIFEELNRGFEAQDYKVAAQENFATVKNHLGRLRATIQTVYGANSPYLRELNNVTFRHGRAWKSNASMYFNKDKDQVLLVLHKILVELRVHTPSIVSDKAPLVTFPELQESLAQFEHDHPVPGNTAFIMMSFADTPAHREITATIKDTLASFGMRGVRADDKEYHTDLYPNIRTYLEGSGFGIAVYEHIGTTFTNPNIAFEVGYMFALKKRVCLLKEQSVRDLHTDLIGKLYMTFDQRNIGPSIEAALSRWLYTYIAAASANQSGRVSR